MLVGVGLPLQGPLQRGGAGIDRIPQVPLALDIELVGEPEQLRLGGRATAAAALGHVDRLVVEHPGEFDAAVAHHSRLNPDRAGGRVPFGRRPPLDRWTQHDAYPHPLQGGDQGGDRQALRPELRRVEQPLLDLLNGEQRVIGAAFVEVAKAAARQRNGPGPPALIRQPERVQQGRQIGGSHHHIAGSGRCRRPRQPQLLKLERQSVQRCQGWQRLWRRRPGPDGGPGQADTDQQARQAAIAAAAATLGRLRAVRAGQGLRTQKVVPPC